MRVWNKWIVAKEGRKAYIALDGNRNPGVVQRLQMLGDHPTIEQIKEITNGGIDWNVPKCDECNRYDDEREVIELGEYLEDSARVFICLPCLIKALQLLDP